MNALRSGYANLNCLLGCGDPNLNIYTGRLLDIDDVEDYEEAPENEVENIEQEVLDQATAASTISELKLKSKRLRVWKLSPVMFDAKVWTQNGVNFQMATDIFTQKGISEHTAEPEIPYGAGNISKPVPSPRQKIVIFTEHRDTLNYLHTKITSLLGRYQAVVIIHGGLGREERRKTQENFLHNPEVQVLLATDAAGEGINLQRAHLMVNYDLPWNPNRIEQRFGRIHRIGQTEVCHLWNLVAEETREGDVYRTLLEKLEQARHSLGGQVFDVLGKLQFEGKQLRELLIEAIRYGEQPEVRARLEHAIAEAVDSGHLKELIDEHALAHDTMDSSRVAKIREEMERAEARRLQPFILNPFSWRL